MSADDLITGLLTGMIMLTFMGAYMLPAPLRRQFRDVLRLKRRHPELKALHRAKTAINDMSTFKAQRRVEEMEKWTNDWLALEPRPEPTPEPPRQAKVTVIDQNGARIDMETGTITVPTAPGHRYRQVKWGKHTGQYMYSERHGDTLLRHDGTIEARYGDGHYTTCPYECDCPKWARREG